jgi:carboxyl-terminal processing protease
VDYFSPDRQIAGLNRSEPLSVETGKLPQRLFYVADFAILCATSFLFMIWKKSLFGWMAITLNVAAMAQMPDEQQQAIVLKRMIERTHYSPRAVNDSFSSDVFCQVIRNLDPVHLVLSAEEIAQLSALRYSLDDELQGGGWKFLDLLTRLYGTAIRRADSLANQVLQKPLDLSAADKILMSTNSGGTYAASVKELKEGWTKYTKLQLLHSAYDLSLTQTPKLSLKDALAKHEPLLRQKIRRRLLQTFERFKDPKALRNELLETYLVSVSQCFDPHTMYLSPEQNDRFKTSLSKEDVSYGFMVDDKDGKTIIQHLMPGGPAWRSGEVHRNDQLLQMSFDGKEAVDVTLLDAEEAEELLANKSAGSMTMRIKKGDGTIKTVTLRKEKMASEEAKVKGYVLQGNRKVGYISLPDFYTSWEDGAGSSCAEDVAKEIISLKKEGIEGLILDVRYNGGGSMQEAVEMIGIFINDGPVFAAKDKIKASFLKDPNRGTIWDGPLAVLINGQSASASESLAGSLQDLNRAVVIGSPSYGKATMQQILPMDTTAGNRMVNSRFGFVKITVGKLYRLDGNTAQRKGVQPDLLLPDAFDAVEGRELHMPHALPADNIKANGYYKPLAPLPIKELLAASTARLAGSAAFAAVKADIQKIRAFYKMKNGEVPLQPAAFEAWRLQNDATMAGHQPPNAGVSPEFAVLNHKAEKQYLQTNAYAGEINNIQLAQLQKDIYLEESYRIIAHLIQLTNLK